mgnify:CR=1 FL=1
MQDKIVAFAGHRYEWHCIGVEQKLLEVLEDLIHKGYTIFYDGKAGRIMEILILFGIKNISSKISITINILENK